METSLRFLNVAEAKQCAESLNFLKGDPQGTLHEVMKLKSPELWR